MVVQIQIQPVLRPSSIVRFGELPVRYLVGVCTSLVSRRSGQHTARYEHERRLNGYDLREEGWGGGAEIAGQIKSATFTRMRRFGWDCLIGESTSPTAHCCIEAQGSSVRTSSDPGLEEMLWIHM